MCRASTAVEMPMFSLRLVLACLIALTAATACKKSDPSGASSVSKLEAPAIGADQPKVEILAFIDYDCPYCRAQWKPLVGVVEAHKADVRLRVFNLPLDVYPNSVVAAKGAVAAWKLGAIAKYQDKFLADGEITREAIVAWAKAAGLDVAKFTAELDAPATEQVVKRDVALAKALGVYGTPSFVVNGQLMQGGQTAQVWEKRVAEETARADGLLGTGTRREDLIKAIVAVTNAKGAADYEKYVLNGQPAPEAPVPAKVARNSGVASATIQPAGGGTQGLQVGEPVQVGNDGNDGSTVWRVAVRADDPSMGPAGAPVTMVVFEDMECPYCAKLRTTLADLRQKNPDLRIVFKHNPLPFHTHAQAAAEALEAARQQGKFWEMHDYLLQHQDKLDDAGLRAAADELKLNRGQFDTALAAHGGSDRIEADVEQAAALSARGTPNLFVNGRKLVGAKEGAVIQGLIDEERKHAEALIAAGTAKDGVYEAIIGKGKLLDSLGTDEVKLDLANAARRGPEAAAVTIVAFEDFQCPFSARLDPHVREIEKEFEGRVQFAWVDFPLREIHPQAEAFAQAGVEARKQGKFWEFHAAVMADNSKLDDKALRAIAEKAGMDVKALDKALANKMWAGVVEQNRKMGVEAGVKGTPSVFINGHAFVPQTGFSAATFRTAVRRVLGTR
jgi:protein-disulfide isomerase